MISGGAAREGTAGYVLAGGQSARMGRNKALLPWRGTSLLEHIAREVQAAAGVVTIVGVGDRPGFRCVPDAAPGMGPLGGIAAALSDSNAEWNLITACDMPGLNRVWLARLLQDAGDDVTVPVTADNRLHPLCAVWRSTAAPAVQDALDAGTRTVTDVVRRLRCRTIVVEDEALVANVNTPGDWARFAQGQE